MMNSILPVIYVELLDNGPDSLKHVVGIIETGK